MRRWWRTMRSFDLGFLNAEFERCKKMLLTRDRLVDTLMLARRRHPGGSNRLDDLCARYGIDNSRRTKHGALLDAELLAEVYVELIGGRQASLILVETSHEIATARYRTTAAPPRPVRCRRGCRMRSGWPMRRSSPASAARPSGWTISPGIPLSSQLNVRPSLGEWPRLACSAASRCW